MRGQVNAGFRQPSAGELEGGVLAQIVKIIRIRVAAGDREHTRAQNIGYRMGDQVRIAVVGDERGKGVDQAKTLVGGGKNENLAVGTDLSPSNAAVTFFLQMFGKENGSRVSSSVAGMADSVRSWRVASTTNP